MEELRALPAGTPLITASGGVVIICPRDKVFQIVDGTDPHYDVYVRVRYSHSHGIQSVPGIEWPVNPTQVRMLTSRELMLLEDGDL